MFLNKTEQLKHPLPSKTFRYHNDKNKSFYNHPTSDYKECRGFERHVMYEEDQGSEIANVCDAGIVFDECLERRVLQNV